MVTSTSSNDLGTFLVLFNKHKENSIVNVSVYNIFFRKRNLVPATAHSMTKETFLKKLGKHITRLREEAGLSQTDLALRCDKDRQSLNRLEKGKINPSAFYLQELAKELELPVYKLLDFE